MRPIFSATVILLVAVTAQAQSAPDGAAVFQ
jgi:hypothetical protein